MWISARVRCLLVGMLLLLSRGGAVAAEDPVLLHAAGSLRAVMNEIAQAYTRQTGVAVKAQFGGSGLLRERIAQGEPAEVFASANMDHPGALAAAGRAAPAVLFARNRLCALVRPGVRVTSATLLERMLDPGIKLATSTPKFDPSGDYAWLAFRNAEKVQPGSFQRLETKALQLVGAPDSPPIPPGRSAYAHHLDTGRADIFLTYCTSAALATREVAALQTVRLPEALAVAADYGLTVMANGRAAALRFALFILSQEGQAMLVSHGFAAAAR